MRYVLFSYWNNSYEEGAPVQRYAYIVAFFIVTACLNQKNYGFQVYTRRC